MVTDVSVCDRNTLWTLKKEDKHRIAHSDNSMVANAENLQHKSTNKQCEDSILRHEEEDDGEA